MKSFLKKSFCLVASVSVWAMAFAACDTNGNVPENADSYTQGNCHYADYQGNPEPTASPEPQSMQMEIRMSGMGSASDLQPQCSLDGSSASFTGLLAGQGGVDENGTYFAGYVFGEGTFKTPSGCTLPPVNVESMTDVVIRAKLSNTTKNCQSYCETRASGYAEAQCGTSPSSATCRAQAQAQYENTCTTQCTGSTTRRIVAEAHLGLSAVATLNARHLGVDGLGTIDANLTFDRIEDQNGSVVQEN